MPQFQSIPHRSMATAASDDESVRLVIRSPMLKKGDLKLQVPLEASVAQIKSQIAEMLEEPTLPAEQRLIYAGRLLADNTCARELLKQHDLKEQHVFHLMTPTKSEAASDFSASNAPSLGPVPSSLPARPSSFSPLSASMPVAAHPSGSFTPSSTEGVGLSSHPQTPALQPHAEPQLLQPRPVVRCAAAPQHSHEPSRSQIHAQWPQLPQLPYQQFVPVGPSHYLVVQEICGQPYVFSLPVLPTLMGGFTYAPHAAAMYAPSAGSWPGAPFGISGFHGLASPHVPFATHPATHPATYPGTYPGTYPAASPEAEVSGVALPHAAEEERADWEARDGLQERPPVMAAGGVGAAAGFDREALNGDEEQTDPLKLILKLAFFVYILSQDGGPHRVYLLSATAVVIFLAQTGRLEFLRRFAARPQVAANEHAPVERADADGGAGEGAGAGANADAGAGVNADVGANEGVGARAAADGQSASGTQLPATVAAVPPPRRSLLRDIENVIVTFVASLLPA